MALSIPAATDRQTDPIGFTRRTATKNFRSLSEREGVIESTFHPSLHPSVNLSDSDVWYLSQRGWPRYQVV